MLFSDELLEVGRKASEPITVTEAWWNTEPYNIRRRKCIIEDMIVRSENSIKEKKPFEILERDETYSRNAILKYSESWNNKKQ